jgi:hypothetical protein
MINRQDKIIDLVLQYYKSFGINYKLTTDEKNLLVRNTLCNIECARASTNWKLKLKNTFLIILLSSLVGSTITYSQNNDSCYVLLSLKKNNDLKITSQMGTLSKNGIFFYQGEHITILFKDNRKVGMGELIKISKDSLLITTGYNINVNVDTVSYSIAQIKKIFYNGWGMKYTRYNFTSYKLKGDCYSSDIATPKEMQRAKDWWKKR